MYLLDFVNLVRQAQGYEAIDRMPQSADDGSCPLELAMGGRFDHGLIRFADPRTAAAVAGATGLPLAVDRVSIALPTPLGPHASSLAGSRDVHNRSFEPGREPVYT